MAKSWTDIAEHFRGLRASCSDPQMRAALGGVEQLVAHIASGTLAGQLYGWTSMTDFCIQQVDIEPYSGPFLRMTSQDDGQIKFRYEDTAIKERQWSRCVPPEGAPGRFDAFLEQLRWVGDRQR